MNYAKLWWFSTDWRATACCKSCSKAGFHFTPIVVLAWKSTDATVDTNRYQLKIGIDLSSVYAKLVIRKAVCSTEQQLWIFVHKMIKIDLYELIHKVKL